MSGHVTDDVDDGDLSATDSAVPSRSNDGAVAMVCSSPPADGQPMRVEPQAAPTGSLEPDEAAAIAELRKRVGKGESGWADGARAEAAAHMDDFTLLRFVKSRPDGIDEALIMFREAMEWRAGRGTSKLFAELHPFAPPTARQRASRAHFYGGCNAKAAPPFSAPPFPSAPSTVSPLSRLTLFPSIHRITIAPLRDAQHCCIACIGAAPVRVVGCA